MNERIKELAEQCYHLYSEHHIDLERFAKLIVQECADICYNRDYTNGTAYGEQIEKHFGVES